METSAENNQEMVEKANNMEDAGMMCRFYSFSWWFLLLLPDIYCFYQHCIDIIRIYSDFFLIYN